MTKQDIIKQIAAELMYDDEWMEYPEALQKAKKIYNSLYEEKDEDVL